MLGAALCFVAGFSTVFVALGATASWIGQAVGAYLTWLGYIAGVLVVLMGLHFLHVIRIPLLDRTARVGVAQKAGRADRRLCDRACLRLRLEPCVGPVLAAILLMAGAHRAPARARGCCLFIRSASACRSWWRRPSPAPSCAGARAFARGMAAIEKAMGALLVIAGVLIFTGQMPAIAYWLIEMFPALGKIG